VATIRNVKGNVLHDREGAKSKIAARKVTAPGDLKKRKTKTRGEVGEDPGKKSAVEKLAEDKEDGFEERLRKKKPLRKR